MTKRRFLVTFPTLLAVPFLLTACSKRSSVSPDTSGGSQATPSLSTPSPATPTPEPEFKLTADAYDAEIQKDSNAALRKYEGKWIELTGTVKNVGDYIEKRKTRSIGMGPDQRPISVIFAQAERLPGRFSLGQTVRLKGLVGGRKAAGNLGLSQGEVIELGPTQLVKLTAEELGKAYTDDLARAKYLGKTVILSGTISKVLPVPINQFERNKTKNFLRWLQSPESTWPARPLRWRSAGGAAQSRRHRNAVRPSSRLLHQRTKNLVFPIRGCSEISIPRAWE